MPITVLRDPEAMRAVASSVEDVLHREIDDGVGFVLVAFVGEDATVCSNVNLLTALSCLYSVVVKLTADKAPPPTLNS